MEVLAALAAAESAPLLNAWHALGALVVILAQRGAAAR